MKAAKFREMTDEELQRQRTDMEGEMFNLQIRKASRRLEQPLRIRTLRKDLARAKTIIRERTQSAR